LPRLGLPMLTPPPRTRSWPSLVDRATLGAISRSRQATSFCFFLGSSLSPIRGLNLRSVGTSTPSALATLSQVSPRLTVCSSFSRGGTGVVVWTRRDLFLPGIGASALMPFQRATLAAVTP